MMTKRKWMLRVHFILVAYLLSGVLLAGSPAPQEGRGWSDIYDRVLADVFPLNLGDFSDQKRYQIVLRFLPSDSPEAQIRITVPMDGQPHVVLTRIPKGHNPVFQQMDSMLQQDSQIDASALSKRIHVENVTVEPSRRLRRLLAELPRVPLSPVLDTRATLDGTRYQYWYDAVSNQTYFSIMASSSGRERTDHTLVRWMSQVREEVVKRQHPVSRPQQRRTPLGN